jgi:hypothetical protein
MSLYSVIEDYIPRQAREKRKWVYGYDDQYDIVIISKDGTLGEVYEINGLKIGLPKLPNGNLPKGNNKWEPAEYPKELARIKSIFEWNQMSVEFKVKWVDYIENEFSRRELGHWFINNGKPTYITGSHYMYLQWSKIDVGLPDFRESNRVFWIFWEACKADERCFGMCYLKNRRSGFSFMSSSEISNIGTLAKDAKLGIQSKTGPDAKEMFTNKVVPIVRNYPFFFKPVQDGMDNPKTELSFRLPAKKITKKNMAEKDDESITGLDTTIDWLNTADNSYDGQKLLLLIEDESGKILAPNNILNGWRVRKTCLRLGSRIVGKCMMGSTVNALQKGGQNFKDMYYDSNPRKRNANGQTKSGLYALFIPMDYNFEGFIDEYGFAVIDDPEKPVMGIDGRMIRTGVVSYWENEVAALKNDPDALNEFYRQYPRTESHAFRDESKQSLYNLTKIYQQIDYNDGLMKHKVLTRGSFHWKNGVVDSTVVWSPDPRGRFIVSWIPPAELQNNMIVKDGYKTPSNEEFGAFGCDSYDISGVVGGGGSNGALHGLTGTCLHPDVPSNMFFLEYIARPQTPEDFYEDVLMACVFYGMPVLAENNKPRLLYHFKNRGYRKYSMNRPDKSWQDLSKSEKELGGIPNTSEDVKQTHAGGIKTYIEQYVGLDIDGTYRDPEDMGTMYFNRTLEDWARFDINNRTKHDASISSGLAIMGVRRHMFKVKKEKSKIMVNFGRYNQSGSNSELIE